MGIASCLQLTHKMIVVVESVNVTIMKFHVSKLLSRASPGTYPCQSHALCSAILGMSDSN